MSISKVGCPCFANSSVKKHNGEFENTYNLSFEIKSGWYNEKLCYQGHLKWPVHKLCFPMTCISLITLSMAFKVDGSNLTPNWNELKELLH